MFGKRTGQAGATIAPLRPAPAPAPASGAAEVMTLAPAGAGFASPTGAVQGFARPDDSVATATAKATDRLDALASRPKPAPEAAPRPAAPAAAGPKPTKGLDQLKKAQAVAEIVREQSDYYHATKTTIFNLSLIHI